MELSGGDYVCFGSYVDVCLGDQDQPKRNEFICTRARDWPIERGFQPGVYKPNIIVKDNTDVVVFAPDRTKVFSLVNDLNASFSDERYETAGRCIGRRDWFVATEDDYDADMKMRLSLKAKLLGAFQHLLKERISSGISDLDDDPSISLENSFLRSTLYITNRCDWMRTLEGYEVEVIPTKAATLHSVGQQRTRRRSSEMARAGSGTTWKLVHKNRVFAYAMQYHTKHWHYGRVLYDQCRRPFAFVAKDIVPQEGLHLNLLQVLRCNMYFTKGVSSLASKQCESSRLEILSQIAADILNGRGRQFLDRQPKTRPGTATKSTTELTPRVNEEKHCQDDLFRWDQKKYNWTSIFTKQDVLKKVFGLNKKKDKFDFNRQRSGPVKRLNGRKQAMIRKVFGSLFNRRRSLQKRGPVRRSMIEDSTPTTFNTEPDQCFQLRQPKITTTCTTEPAQPTFEDVTPTNYTTEPDDGTTSGVADKEECLILQPQSSHSLTDILDSLLQTTASDSQSGYESSYAWQAPEHLERLPPFHTFLDDQNILPSVSQEYLLQTPASDSQTGYESSYAWQAPEYLERLPPFHTLMDDQNVLPSVNQHTPFDFTTLLTEHLNWLSRLISHNYSDYPEITSSHLFGSLMSEHLEWLNRLRQHFESLQYNSYKQN